MYSDLGDYPTALRYFQDALDILPPDNGHQDIRSSVLSQTGRLLISLSLFEEAEPYIQETLEIDRNTGDTTNLIYDLQLSGGLYLRDGNYPLAEEKFRESLILSKNMPDYHAAKSRMYIAATKYKTGDIDSALFYIRNTIETVKPAVRNSALGYASNIYLKAGIPDTAYIYAKDLVDSDDPDLHEIGYQVLLAPQLRKYLENDSLDQYISEYRTLLECYYDDNNNRLALNRQNFYNYQLHEKGKMIAERKVSSLKQWILVSLLATAILAVVSLFLKNRSKNNIIRLQHALNHIERLKYELNIATTRNSMTPPAEGKATVTENLLTLPMKKTEQVLRENLKSEIISLYENSNNHSTVSRTIIQSGAYQKIQEYISKNVSIAENDPLWNEIEQAVLECSPKFRTNLDLLTSGNLTAIDYRTALLVKCGIKPSKMGILLGRSNGAIVSRREALSVKIFDEKKSVKVIDGIIRLL